MAANMPLIERADIHKSCKALEAIVNAFNDYCQTAEALALAQKKLARTLKDAAGLKATNGLVSNVLNAAAILLESLAEVDAKFVKIIDKECEGASNDLKKWFKKLAKEEKNHDDKINTANAKIKQAGLTYEKKAKKKDRDAGEEHTRYVNLLSSIGPEMSQERYNHTLFVSQRHTATVYNVASSISRAADAEWVRACDCVRKFAPVIGRIGECRAYIEGGWMMNMPDGGGEFDEKNGRDTNAVAREHPTNGAVDEMGVRTGMLSSGSVETAPSTHRYPAAASSLGSAMPPASITTSRNPPSAPLSLPSRSPSAQPPPTSHVPVQFDRLNTDSVRSIESLSSFPSPPTHFPLPAMTQLPSSPLARLDSDDARPTEGSSDSPISEKRGESNKSSDRHDQQANAAGASTPMMMPVGHATPALTDDSGTEQTSGRSQLPTPVASPGAGEERLEKDDTVKLKPAERPQSPQYRRRDSISPTTNEVGTQERKVSGPIERSESVLSTNSIVASMRDKWGRGEVSSPAPPRERSIPKVPNKVSDLASRYVPATDNNAEPLSPRATGQVFQNPDRSRQVSGSSTKSSDSVTPAVAEGSSTKEDDKPGPAQESSLASAAAGVTTSELLLIRRRKRIEELEELERREQAQALRAREREIEMQTKELEHERERLRTLGIVSSVGTGGTRATGVRSNPQHSYSMVNLVPTHSGPGEVLVRPVSQHGEPLVLTASPSSSSSTSNPPIRPDHAPYCGCQACSASQYSVNNPHPHVQVIAQPRAQKEKPKGWMRRLSMPVVGNAFSSSDSKKAYGVGVGVAGGPQVFEQDSTGGISNVRPRKISFGRR